jgi:SAM-dependent methyltransferase
MRRKLPHDGLLCFSGTEVLTQKAQAKFVRYFLNSADTVLEISCGKAAMLSLLKREGVHAYGIDLSPTSVKYCRAKGLKAVHGEVLSHMKSLSSRSLGGIFCAHVIEHLPPSDAIALVKNAFGVRKPGGRFIIITLNAKGFRTAERFWLDSTHVRSYPKKLLRFLLQKEGFKTIGSFADREPANTVVERVLKTLVRWWFLGFMYVGDLIVIAER